MSDGVVFCHECNKAFTDTVPETCPQCGFPTSHPVFECEQCLVYEASAWPDGDGEQAKWAMG